MSKHREIADKFYAEYSKLHRACPHCNSIEVSQTYMGYTLKLDAMHEYQDENRASCHDCGWLGIKHEMVVHLNKLI